jgi:glycyl-tRNA synthetase (class II)
MQQNDAVKKHYCELCNYATIRKYDLKRHQNAKHIDMVTRECFETLDEKNVASNEKNVNPNGKNVNPQLICKILECNAKFARLECLILLLIFTFFTSKLLPSITINYFLKMEN